MASDEWWIDRGMEMVREGGIESDRIADGRDAGYWERGVVVPVIISHFVFDWGDRGESSLDAEGLCGLRAAQTIATSSKPFSLQ